MVVLLLPLRLVAGIRYSLCSPVGSPGRCKGERLRGSFAFEGMVLLLLRLTGILVSLCIVVGNNRGLSKGEGFWRSFASEEMVVLLLRLIPGILVSLCIIVGKNRGLSKGEGLWGSLAFGFLDPVLGFTREQVVRDVAFGLVFVSRIRRLLPLLRIPLAVCDFSPSESP